MTDCFAPGCVVCDTVVISARSQLRALSVQSTVVQRAEQPADQPAEQRAQGCCWGARTGVHEGEEGGGGHCDVAGDERSVEVEAVNMSTGLDVLCYVKCTYSLGIAMGSLGCRIATYCIIAMVGCRRLS